MGDLYQRFYHGADVFVLDASAPVDLRPWQCGLENHFHQYQHFIHAGRAADVYLSIKLPHIVDNTLATVGGMIGPVAMLVAGMLLASLPLRSIMWTPRLLSCCFFKADFDSDIIAFAVKVCGFAIMMRMRIRLF